MPMITLKMLNECCFFKSLLFPAKVNIPNHSTVLLVSLFREFLSVVILKLINFHRCLDWFLAPFRRQVQESTRDYQVYILINWGRDLFNFFLEYPKYLINPDKFYLCVCSLRYKGGHFGGNSSINGLIWLL